MTTVRYLLSNNFMPGLTPYVAHGLLIVWGFPGGSDGEESGCNAGHLGSIPGSGRSPGEGNSNSLQYSCLENPMDRWAIVHGGHKRVGQDLGTNPQPQNPKLSQHAGCELHRT